MEDNSKSKDDIIDYEEGEELAKGENNDLEYAENVEENVYNYEEGEQQPVEEQYYDEQQPTEEQYYDEQQYYEEQQPTEEQYYDEQPAEEQYYEEQPAEEQYYEEQPAEEQYYEEQPAEEQYYEEQQPSEEQYYEEQPAEEQYYEEQPAEEQYYEEQQPTEEQYYEEQPAEQQYYEEQPAEEQYYEEQQPVVEQPVVEEKPVEEEHIEKQPVAEEPVDEEHIEEEPVVEEKPADEQPADEQPADEQPSVEEHVEEQPVIDKPVEEEHIEEEPVAEEPVEEQPSEEQPSEEQPTEEQPTEEQPAEEHIEEEHVEEQPTEEQSVAEEPIEEEHVEKQPSAEEEHVEEEHIEEQPSEEQPSEEQPSEEQPSEEQPSEEKPVAEEKPSVEQPVAEESAAEEEQPSAEEQPVVEEPIEEEPAAEEHIEEQPSEEQPVEEQHIEEEHIEEEQTVVVEQPAVEESAAKEEQPSEEEQPVVVEQPVEEQTVVEQQVVEPSAEEQPSEEQPAAAEEEPSEEQPTTTTTKPPIQRQQQSLPSAIPKHHLHSSTLKKDQPSIPSPAFNKHILEAIERLKLKNTSPLPSSSKPHPHTSPKPLTLQNTLYKRVPLATNHKPFVKEPLDINHYLYYIIDQKVYRVPGTIQITNKKTFMVLNEDQPQLELGTRHDQLIEWSLLEDSSLLQEIYQHHYKPCHELDVYNKLGFEKTTLRDILLLRYHQSNGPAPTLYELENPDREYPPPQSLHQQQIEPKHFNVWLRYETQLNNQKAALEQQKRKETAKRQRYLDDLKNDRKKFVKKQIPHFTISDRLNQLAQPRHRQTVHKHVEQKKYPLMNKYQLAEYMQSEYVAKQRWNQLYTYGKEKKLQMMSTKSTSNAPVVMDKTQYQEEMKSYEEQHQNFFDRLSKYDEMKIKHRKEFEEQKQRELPPKQRHDETSKIAFKNRVEKGIKNAYQRYLDEKKARDLIPEKIPIEPLKNRLIPRIYPDNYVVPSPKQSKSTMNVETEVQISHRPQLLETSVSAPSKYKQAMDEQLQKNKCLNEERKARLEKEKKQKEEETKAHIPPSIRKLAKERQIASQDSSSKKVSSMDSTEQMKPLERRSPVDRPPLSRFSLPPKVQINSTYTNTFTPIGSDANKKPKATNAVSLAPEKKSSPRDEDEDVPMIDIQEEEQKEYDQTEQDTMKAAQLMD